MAHSKSDQFPAGDIQLSEWAKALAHPARVAVLKVLAERKSCICGEIVDVLPLAQATVSQHLKALKEAGFVDGTIDGPRSCYCLNTEALQRAREAMGAFFDHLDQASSCC